MKTAHNRRMVALVGGVAASGGIALASMGMVGGAANGSPEQSTTTSISASQLPACSDFLDADGNLTKHVDMCRPVDPFTEPNLTLAQRESLVNDQSPQHDELVAQLRHQFGG